MMSQKHIQNCDHLVYSGVDPETLQITCHGCGLKWTAWKGEGPMRNVGNINNGTFKIYGKEQADPMVRHRALIP